jgi:DNA-binding GntR family transcriptional regulator
MVQGNDFQRMLSNEIFDYVKRRDIPVGSRLTEKSLCEEFNVSRTPVRAALKILANDGFIEYVRNKGYFTRQDGGAINRRAAPETDEELLYLRLTRDRLEGELASEFTEADLLRRYEVPKHILTRVLQRLLRFSTALPKRSLVPRSKFIENLVQATSSQFTNRLWLLNLESEASRSYANPQSG